MDKALNQSFLQYRSTEYRQYRYWLFREGQLLQLYREPAPNTEEISFTFWEINSSTREAMEQISLENFPASEHESLSIYNYEKMKLFYFRYLLRGWSFAEELRFAEDGGLDDESFRKVTGLHPVILRELAGNIFEAVFSEEEITTIHKQGYLIFAKKQTVQNAHPLLALYCNLSEMWKKFGLNYFDLKRLSLYEKNGLKTILDLENQIRTAELHATETRNNY